MLRMQRRDRGSFQSTVRRALDDAGNARPVSVSFDFEAHADDLLWALREIAARTSPVSKYRLRIASHVVSGEKATPLLDALASSSPTTRRAAADACGLMRIEAAVPTLGLLLGDRVRRVRRAAAEALGRIGGYRAADELLRGLRSRRLPSFWLLLALVRAVPDHYIESRLGAESDSRSTPWLALAAGIRRRKAARPYLVALLASDDQHARTVACRALGWIADPADVPALRGALHSDAEPVVREAAARALRRFHEPAAQTLLDSIAIARNHPPIEKPQLEPADTTPVPELDLSVDSEGDTDTPVSGVSPDFVGTTHIEVVGDSPAAEPPPVPVRVMEPPASTFVVIEPTRRPALPRTQSQGPTLLGQALSSIRKALQRRAKKRRVELPPLTPLVWPTTPHHYTPDPSLLDDDPLEPWEERA